MDGRNLIGYRYSALADKILEAIDPATRQKLEGHFHIATPKEIDAALSAATDAFAQYKHSSGVERACFLRAIADEIMELGDTLIGRAMQETGLPEGRLKGERGRTLNQLRLFADLAEEGSWVEASIDTAQPNRQPLPKPDIRKMRVPIGPVVIFTASNFPLAFSTAGGDTASALAAGCPVVVKAHESHLGTNALVAMAIQKAAQKSAMPEGIFSSLNGTGPGLGQALVHHPLTKAIAFTGSLRAGRAIYDAAASRKEPIPVFAEMGSTNPVILLEEALQKRSDQLASQLASSINLGAGQFCTNPGLIIAIESDALTGFEKKLVQTIIHSKPATMLNEQICKHYQNNSQALLTDSKVELLGQSTNETSHTTGLPMVAAVSARHFMDKPALQKEIFGPFSLLVRCANKTELLEVAQSLSGQLTATLMAEREELPAERELVSRLQDKVGRLILNGVPTGVEVCHSMQHGGPYPATTDSRSTSVGADAIKRFGRPLAYQNWLPELLPKALQDDNPLNIWRKVNGIFER